MLFQPQYCLVPLSFVDQFSLDVFFKYKFGIEAKDYSQVAQLKNLEEVEIQTQWIIDTLYEVQDNVEYSFGNVLTVVSFRITTMKSGV